VSTWNLTIVSILNQWHRVEFSRRDVSDVQNISVLLFLMPTSGVETLQVELLKTLLDNSDGTSAQASSRKIFLHKFCTFLHENLLSSRVSYHDSYHQHLLDCSVVEFLFGGGGGGGGSCIF
jgi:hypothetical protein